MLGLISTILAAIVSFAGGASGVGKFLTPKQPTTPVILSRSAACYNPQPNKKLILRWPDNYVNVSDNRSAFNPNLFNSSSPFNSDVQCQNLVMANKAERTFILVREDVRISSCKTDELAGPLGKGTCPGFQDTSTGEAASQRHRGSCDINGYTDLRKVAEVKKGGETLEIFWNPFSYNVGCNYKQDDNCGPGQRRNLNLKDFIYVLTRRDAYLDPAKPGEKPLNEGCPVQWDAGSANFDACSHHFDVYMAEDLYVGSKSAPATNDPESQYYFIKQVLEKCQEKTLFIPAPEANLTIPPLFIKSPFIWQNDKSVYSSGKIIPGNSQEQTNYLIFVWTFPDVFYNFKNQSTVNLLRLPTDEIAGPLKVCANDQTQLKIEQPGPPAPLPDCYDSLGVIHLKDDKGKILKYRTYSKLTSPQTFTLLKTDDAAKGYVYTITDKEYPENTQTDKSLQLRALQLIQRNQWTWATPWCKPAIYFYPPQPLNMTVKLDLDGELTVSNPVYDSQSGWAFVAQPDGRIQEPLTLSEYPYLYYEADLKGVSIPKEGFVYAVQDLPKSLKSLMEKLGFNEKETSDFLAYWLPRLTEKPYYFVTLLPEEVINAKEKLTFSKNPDTLIRSRFVFEGLDAPISVKPLTNIPTHSRSGFVVADWGGTIVGKSCSEVTVK